MTQEEKRLKWSQHISAANFELKRLHEYWLYQEQKVRNRKEQIILETAEKLEEDDMPREYIMDEMIRGLCPEPKEGEEEPETYVDASYVRKILKKGKYDIVEKSTVQTQESSDEIPVNHDKKVCSTGTPKTSSRSQKITNRIRS